jgi:LmbE family N-acetylglucosaminyl deacetylase
LVPRVLGFFAHPDDEAFAAGGTLAWLSARGARVRVLCATGGEAGGDPALRRAELEASCVALGAEPRALGWPDGGLAVMPPARARTELLSELRAFEPHLLLTLGPDGAYGHADHLACTALLSEVAAELRPAPRVLHAVFPPGLFAPVHRALRKHLGPELIRGDASQLGAAPSGAQWVLQLEAAAAAAKRAAIVAHRSQLRSVDPPVFLWPGLLERLLQQERFEVVSGPALPAGAHDPLAGLP